jgi:hypothetical protein
MTAAEDEIGGRREPGHGDGPRMVVSPARAVGEPRAGAVPSAGDLRDVPKADPPRWP